MPGVHYVLTGDELADALTYADVKQMVRTGLEHDFLPGPSLWREPDIFTRPVAACSTEFLGAEKPSGVCAAFLKSSEKAQQQWELERRFRAFESTNWADWPPTRMGKGAAVARIVLTSASPRGDSGSTVIDVEVW